MARLPARLRDKPRVAPKGGVQKPHRPRLHSSILHPERRDPKRKLIGDGSLREGMSEREITEKFVERALRMGASSVPQLARFTDLSEARVREIREDLKFKLRVAGKKYSEKTLKVRQMERMLIEGELTLEEIAKRAGTTVGAVEKARWRLKKEGIKTLIPGSEKPPLQAARMVLKLEVLMQLSGKPPSSCIPGAEAFEVKGASMYHWIYRTPKIFIDARTFADGRHWKKAHEQLKGWIEKREGEGQYRGKKYDPNVALTVKLARDRMRAMEGKK